MDDLLITYHYHETNEEVLAYAFEVCSDLATYLPQDALKNVNNYAFFALGGCLTAYPLSLLSNE